MVIKIFPVLLRYNWHTVLVQGAQCNDLKYVYITKWL